MQQTTQVASGHITLQVVTYGDPQRTPVVLIHGYPDNHRVWQAVAQQLAQQYFVVTYDVRGAGASSVPANRSDYRLAVLMEDLRAVVDQVIPGRTFHLAGHDWGAIQGWEAVTTAPLRPRILTYSAISGPCLDHVGCLIRRKTTSLSLSDKAKVIRQILSSWYILAFHVPMLASIAWQAGLGSKWPTYLERREGVREAAPNPTQAQDGRYGVQLYRANIFQKLMRPEKRYAACPVQVILPARDNYVGGQLFDGLEEWVPELTRSTINAGHWVLLSDPGVIAERIGEFIEQQVTKPVAA